VPKHPPNVALPPLLLGEKNYVYCPVAYVCHPRIELLLSNCPVFPPMLSVPVFNGEETRVGVDPKAGVVG
jgi:hypothetical protein